MLQLFSAKFRIEFFVLRFVVAAALSLLPTYLPGQTVPLPVSTALATTSSTDTQNITLSGLGAAAGSAQTDGTAVYFLNAVSATVCDANARIDSTPVTSGAITPFVTSATPLEAAQPSTAPTSICGSPVLSGTALFISASYAPTPSTARSGIFRFSTSGGAGADVLATGDIIAGAGTVTAVSAAVADGKGGVFIPFTTATGSYLYASATGGVTAPATSSCNGVSIVSAIPAPGPTDGTAFPSLVGATDIASGKAVTVVTASSIGPSADCHDVVYNQFASSTVITPAVTAAANAVVYLSGATASFPVPDFYSVNAGSLTKLFVSTPFFFPLPPSVSASPYNTFVPDPAFAVSGSYLVFKFTITRPSCTIIIDTEKCSGAIPVAQALYGVYLPTSTLRVLTKPATTATVVSPPRPGSLATSGILVYGANDTPSTTLSAVSLAGIPTATQVTVPATSLAGEPVTLTASVTPYTQGSSNATGTVTFLDGATSLGSATLDSTGKASIPVSFLVGAHSITAAYSGDSAFISSTSASAKMQTGITTSISFVSSPAIILPGDQFTVTAHVVPSQVLSSGGPTGTVTFSCGPTAPLTPGSLDSVAVTTCSALSAPAMNATVAYAGDANYSGSTVNTDIDLGYTSALQLTASPSTVAPGSSITLTATVTNTTPGATNVIPAGNVTFYCNNSPVVALDARGVATADCTATVAGNVTVNATFVGPLYANSYATIDVVVTTPSFLLGSSTSTGTVSAGGTASYTIAVTPNGGFAAPVALACSGLPTGTSCSFSPSSVTPTSGAVTSTLSIMTTAAAASLEQPKLSALTARDSLMAMLLPFLLLSGLCRRRTPGLMLLLALLCGTLSLTGCAGAKPNNSSPSVSATPSGTYNVTITGISGSLGNSETVVLVVR